jgi:hypothetical protein
MDAALAPAADSIGHSAITFCTTFDTLFATRDHLNFRQPLVTKRFGVRRGPRRREFLGPFPAGAAVPIPLFPPQTGGALHRVTSPSSSM